MIVLWQYEIVSFKNSQKATVLAGVRRDVLEEFAKKVNPYAKVTDTNGERWVLRYIQEELGYKKDSIYRVEIRSKEFTMG